MISILSIKFGEVRYNLLKSIMRGDRGRLKDFVQKLYLPVPHRFDSTPYVSTNSGKAYLVGRGGGRLLPGGIGNIWVEQDECFT